MVWISSTFWPQVNTELHLCYISPFLFHLIKKSKFTNFKKKSKYRAQYELVALEPKFWSTDHFICSMCSPGPYRSVKELCPSLLNKFASALGRARTLMFTLPEAPATTMTYWLQQPDSSQSLKLVWSLFLCCHLFYNQISQMYWLLLWHVFSSVQCLVFSKTQFYIGFEKHFVAWLI